VNWKFWKKTDIEKPANYYKNSRLSKPKDIPEAIGRKMVKGLRLDPDEVWQLKYVTRPSNDQTGIYEFRLFDPDKAKRAGVTVRDWTSLDDRPELILYTGRYNKGGKSTDQFGPRGACDK
jgi:hypothetical protein